MANVKRITLKQLEKLLHHAHEHIRLWVEYRDELIEYHKEFLAGTVPPGKVPPTPPGIPRLKK